MKETNSNKSTQHATIQECETCKKRTHRPINISTIATDASMIQKHWCGVDEILLTANDTFTDGWEYSTCSGELNADMHTHTHGLH